MQKVFSTGQLERVLYIPHEHRKAEVYLRENIENCVYDKPDGESMEGQEADEVYFLTNLSKEEVEANFDNLWVKCETGEKTLKERVDELEDLLGMVIDETLGV